MLRIDGEDIYITRGDSGEIFITPSNDNGSPYELSVGERVSFFVRLLPGSEPVITKIFTNSDQNDDGSFSVTLSPIDTDIPRSSYMYEAKIYAYGGEEICTFIGGGKEKPRFIVT